MSFFDEIVNIFGDNELSPCFRIMWIGDGSLYIEGVKNIKSYTQEKIELNIKNGGLKIFGENLFFKKYCAGDIAVCGKIKSIERI